MFLGWDRSDVPVSIFLVEKELNSYSMCERKWGLLSLHSEVPACVLPMFALERFFYLKQCGNQLLVVLFVFSI